MKTRSSNNKHVSYGSVEIKKEQMQETGESENQNVKKIIHYHCNGRTKNKKRKGRNEASHAIKVACKHME